MKVRSLKKQEKIERILDYGIEAFRKYGYHSSSVQNLAGYCQISKGSFYQYFDTKEHFCKEVIKHYSKRMACIASEIVSQETNGLDKLISFYRAVIKRVKDSEFQSGCLYGDLAAELGGVNKECSEIISACLQKSSSFFEGLIKEGQQDGTIRTDIDSNTLSSLSFNSFTGVILRMKVDGNTAAGEEFVEIYARKLLAVKS